MAATIGIDVRGRVELHEKGGERFGDGWEVAWIEILPQRVVSRGIEGHAFSPEGRRRARSVGAG